MGLLNRRVLCPIRSPMSTTYPTYDSPAKPRKNPLALPIFWASGLSLATGLPSDISDIQRNMLRRAAAQTWKWRLGSLNVDTRKNILQTSRGCHEAWCGQKLQRYRLRESEGRCAAVVKLGIVPRWSPYEDQSGVDWGRDEIGGTRRSSYSRTEGWSENKDDLLGTVLRGISGSGCEDDVERKREQPGMEATSENMHSMHFMAIFAIEAGRWITLRNALLHYARLRTV